MTKGVGPYSNSPVKFTNVSDKKRSSTVTPSDEDDRKTMDFKYGGNFSGKGASDSLPKK